MSFIEKDPRDLCFAALYVAIKNYMQITPEQASRVVNQKGKILIYGRKLTPELIEKINRIMESPNFKDFSNIEKIYKINKYDYCEGGVEVAQVDMWLKRLKEHTEGCSGICESCNMNKDIEITDETTLCEIFCDLEINKGNVSVKQGNKGMHKNAVKCITQDLNGETKFRGFQVYTKVLDKLNAYIALNQDKKVKDIVSSAIAEYMARHK